MSETRDTVRESTAHLWPRINNFEPSPRPLRLRKQAKILSLSRDAIKRLEWFLWHEEKGSQDVSLTCRHFGIARKTFYKWKKPFDTGNLRELEEGSRRPKRIRQKEYTKAQYLQFLPVRRKYLRYGKEKLLRIYREEYPKDDAISIWKIQKMIERSGMYYSPKKNEHIQRKRHRTLRKPRQKIQTLPKEAKEGFLVCLDTVQRSCNGKTRFIYTAIDRHSKVAFAHAYRSHTSKAAEDFLLRLYVLLEGRIANIQTDNGSEFLKHFEKRLTKLNIPHYFSRPRTPKDNGTNERFNRTLSEEFLLMGNMTDDLTLLNHRLTEWLVEYNFHRPHQSLGYETPIQFHYRKQKVLPVCPSSTATGHYTKRVLVLAVFEALHNSKKEQIMSNDNNRPVVTYRRPRRGGVRNKRAAAYPADASAEPEAFDVIPDMQDVIRDITLHLLGDHERSVPGFAGLLDEPLICENPDEMSHVAGKKAVAATVRTALLADTQQSNRRTSVATMLQYILEHRTTTQPENTDGEETGGMRSMALRILQVILHAHEPRIATSGVKRRNVSTEDQFALEGMAVEFLLHKSKVHDSNVHRAMRDALPGINPQECMAMVARAFLLHRVAEENLDVFWALQNVRRLH